MDHERIYIQLLDGTTTWIQVNAIKVTDKQYKIIEDNEYTDYIDPLYIHEFYPGDIVELEEHIFQDGSNGRVANKLISIGRWLDRKYNEFKFRATLGQLKIDIQTAERYRLEIDRVKYEHSAGQFFYPQLMETINKLNSLNRP